MRTPRGIDVTVFILLRRGCLHNMLPLLICLLVVASRWRRWQQSLAGVVGDAWLDVRGAVATASMLGCVVTVLIGDVLSNAWGAE